MQQEANRVYSESAPWKLKPSREAAASWASRARSLDAAAEQQQQPVELTPEQLRLAGTLYTILESLRVAAVLLQPAMPACAPRLLAALGLYEADGATPAARLTAWASASPGAAMPHNFQPRLDLGPLILFPKPAFTGPGADAGAAGAASAGVEQPLSRKAKRRLAAGASAREGAATAPAAATAA